MKNLLTRIDQRILHDIEICTHWFQRHYTKTSFWLAKWLVTFDVFFVFFALLIRNERGQLSFFDILISSSFFLGAFIFSSYYWKVEEHRAFLRISRGTQNPRKISRGWLKIRVIFLVLPIYPILISFASMFVLERSVSLIEIFFLTIAISFFALLFFTSVLYLIACDPLSPKSERKNVARKAVLVPIRH